MKKIFTLTILLGTTILCLPACADQAKLKVEEGMGPNPTLPSPSSSLIPTVNIAPASSWLKDETPKAAPGLKVNALASGLDHPRWIYVLPNNDVLVAESDAPPKPDDGKGPKGAIMKMVMKKAGSGVAKSANRVTLLRDEDGDGIAEAKYPFLNNLNSPIGMALVNNNFYVANTDSIVMFPYTKGETTINTPGVKLTDLPAGSINHHWTKNIIASPDGKYLYATVGSNSNVGENGLEVEKDRARILQVDLKTGQSRPYATGLRNPNGMGFEPTTKTLWTDVNERDELGSDLVPDYMTSVKDGAFYGWPYSYYGQTVDTRVKPQNPNMVVKAVKPDYALGPHTASLGLAFSEGKMLPQGYRSGVFIGQHGSWNREPRSGYKVIFVPFSKGMPSGPSKDVLTGFLTDDGHAKGRPVEVAIDKKGALLVADDVGGTIWRVTPEK